jgi:hypothetical protein
MYMFLISASACILLVLSLNNDWMKYSHHKGKWDIHFQAKINQEQNIQSPYKRTKYKVHKQKKTNSS